MECPCGISFLRPPPVPAVAIPFPIFSTLSAAVFVPVAAIIVEAVSLLTETVPVNIVLVVITVATIVTVFIKAIPSYSTPAPLFLRTRHTRAPLRLGPRSFSLQSPHPHSLVFLKSRSTLHLPSRLRLNAHIHAH